MPAVWRRDHPLWLAPHRPFFLLAGLWAALVPIVWILPQGLGPEPVAWHRHELLFGMGGAAVGGYLLTALPAWTGAPVPPAATRRFVPLWFVGRLAFVLGLPPLPAAIAEAGYFLALGIFLSQRVLKAGAWRRMPLAAAPLLLGGSALLSTPELGLVDDDGVMRMLPLFYGLLISLVGGRAVPAFTVHWAAQSRPQLPVADPLWLSRSALAALGVAIALVLADAPIAAGPPLVLSGVLQLLRMLPWRSWRTVACPALLLLHLAWFWLATGLAMTGASLLSPGLLGAATGLHALTMGAMGTMMLAIMARAAMIRRDGRLHVSWQLALAFALVFISVPIRLGMAFAADSGQSSALQLSAILWSGGWGLFLWDFRRALQGPVPRPVLSGRSEPYRDIVPEGR
jgi:uncharacterized protein involved in response to NO